MIKKENPFIKETITIKIRKKRIFFLLIQVPTTPQWWSTLAQQQLQEEQWVYKPFSTQNPHKWQ